MVINFNGYVPPFRPTPNITPFTYRDGMSYLQQLEEMRVVLNNVVSFVNLEFAELVAGVEQTLLAQLEAVNQSLAAALAAVDVKIAEHDDNIDAKIDDLIAYVNTQVALVSVAVDNVNTALALQTAANNAAMDALMEDVNDAIDGIDSDARILAVVNDVDSGTRERLNELYTTTDAAVFAIVSSLGSNTRILLDSLYESGGGGGDPEISDAIIASYISDTDSITRTTLASLFAAKSVETTVTTGRLTQANLDAAYASRALVDSGRLTQANLDAAYAAKSIETVVTSGRLTQVNLDSAYAAKSIETIVTTGRLTQANLDAAYADNSLEALVASGRLSQTALDARYAPVNISGTYAGRPAANTVAAGTIYYATNVPEVYRSNGTSWIVVGSGGNELAYAVSGSGLNTVSTTGILIPGLSATFVVGERPINIIFTADLANSSATSVTTAIILMDGTARKDTATVGIGADVWHAVTCVWRYNSTALTPGTSHTVTVNAKSSNGAHTARVGGGPMLQIVNV